MTVFQAILGLVLMHLMLWWRSENRTAVPWRMVMGALAAQFVLAVAFTRIPAAGQLFDAITAAMQAIQASTEAGTRFVFGYLAGGPAPYEVVDAQAGYILALRALPVIIVMSAIARLLTYWRILPALVSMLARLLERTMGIGGALGLASAANVLVGMTEAPLLIRPYLQRMNRGELFALMGCGLATIAGTVFVLFADLLRPVIPGAAGHLLVASMMSLPAALGICAVMVPPEAKTGSRARIPSEDEGAFDAVTNGTLQGVQLFFNIVAMLLVLVALVYLVNLGLGLLVIDGAPLSLERLLGWVFAPLCWLMGISWAEAGAAGALVGTKTVLNEFVAYLQFAAMEPGALSAHTRLILTYALCGFANIGSLGMLTAALTVLAPERRKEIIELGWRALVAGTLATCSTGAVVGIVAV